MCEVEGDSLGDRCNLNWVRNLSELCVEAWNDGSEDTPVEGACCYPLKDNVSVVAGVWCVINAVMGASGNLLTLLAIPIAKRNNRFGFRDNCDCTTLFILNLAFSDLLYCVFNLPLYSLQYLTQSWPLSQEMCFAFAAFRYINAFADWMSLAFIAVSRCVGLVWGKWAEKYLTGKNGIIVIVLIWSYAIGLISLAIGDVIGDFGYNCRSGKCDFIEQAGGDRVDPHRFYYGIAFTIPCVIIFVCYLFIWCYVKHSARFLKKHSVDVQMKGQIENREMRMTWTLLLISLCYLFCVGPITICNIVDPDADLPNLHLAFFCIYWLQYSLNFFIYAMRSEQFRTAYVDFLYGIWYNFRRACYHCYCCHRSNNIEEELDRRPSRRTLVYIQSRRSFPQPNNNTASQRVDNSFRRQRTPTSARNRQDFMDDIIAAHDAPSCGCPQEDSGPNIIQTISFKVQAEKVDVNKRKRNKKVKNRRILDLEAAVSSSFVSSSEDNFRIIIVNNNNNGKKAKPTRRYLKRLYSLDSTQDEDPRLKIKSAEGSTKLQQNIEVKIRRRSLTL